MLKDERELVDKVKAVAAKRRTPPLGAELKEDWNLMDFTPEGRPEAPLPPQDFRSEFLEKHYLNMK